LRETLSEREARIKKLEQDNASVTDEFQRYKDATEARGNVPVPIPVKRAPVKYSFLRRRG